MVRSGFAPNLSLKIQFTLYRKVTSKISQYLPKSSILNKCKAKHPKTLPIYS